MVVSADGVGQSPGRDRRGMHRLRRLVRSLLGRNPPKRVGKNRAKQIQQLRSKHNKEIQRLRELLNRAEAANQRHLRTIEDLRAELKASAIDELDALFGQYTGHPK